MTDENLTAQASAWFAEYDKCSLFPEMLALDAYAAGHAAAQQQGQTINPWQEAVDRERVIACLGIAADGVTVDEAVKKVAELIDWHVQVATDPFANGGFSLQPVQQQGQAAPQSAPVGAEERQALANVPFGWVKDAPSGIRSTLDFTTLPGVAEGWRVEGYRVVTLYSLPYLAQQPSVAPVGGGKKWPDDYCPECGSDEVHHSEGDHIQCGNCLQEYFTSIDYSDVVRENLKGLFAIAQQPAALERADRLAEALREAAAMLLADYPETAKRLRADADLLRDQEEGK